MILLWSLIASLVVSLISLIGIITLLVNNKILNNILILFIGFSAGSLISSAFFHLIPEALEKNNNINIVFIYVISGFILFFILEKYLFWRHCHEDTCNIHAFSYLNLIGDGIHNFLDGLIIAASFSVSINIGIITTTAIILHEIPQEIGDFGVLIYAGFSKSKALLFNFLSAIIAILGVLVGYFFTNHFNNFTNVLLPFTAGGFIYISTCGLIPELHKQKEIKRSLVSILMFILGIILLYFL